MERSIVTALADAGLEAGTKRGHKHVGVWVGERKIASVGVHISHGVSSHGFAVNVDNDLDPFTWVVACGLPEVQMTSLQAEGLERGPRLLPQAHGRTASARRSAAASGSSRRAARHPRPVAGLMDVGLAIFLTGEGIHPAELARAPRTPATSRCWSPSTRTSRSRPGCRRDGGAAADKYRRTHDPFVALAFAAAATERLRSARASAS